MVAVAGAVAAVVIGLRRPVRLERTAALALCLVLLPTFVHGFANWSPSGLAGAEHPSGGLLAAVEENVPTGAVVFSAPEASYRLGAYAPVRVCLNPTAHVADTVDNRPRERVRDFLRFVRTGDLSIARACGATWLLVDLERFRLEPDLPVVHRDERWVLYRL